jgi:hypothetical protein
MKTPIPVANVKLRTEERLCYVITAMAKRRNKTEWYETDDGDFYPVPDWPGDDEPAPPRKRSPKKATIPEGITLVRKPAPRAPECQPRSKPQRQTA